MYFDSWIIQNKELVKLIYSFLIIFICLMIVLKTDKLFRLSKHKGIRYFRNAFFFYGIGFFVRYYFGTNNYPYLTNFVFEYFLIMAGFFLLYSLLWKKIEGYHETYSSSLFNSRIFLFHLMALLIVILDFIWGFYYSLFISQIILFGFASIISFNNYFKNKKYKKIPRLYFLAMFLSLIAWILNALTNALFSGNYNIIITIYILNIIIFLLFLYGVYLVRKN
jgi:hypothetical protein